ncbi:flagellar motor switch protein FliM [Gluconobacter morbifer]|uniref:Flagellar motor switch protein FliM n=1 Tax=Gluconobacter morbifer G707 TaxID=1088869 RepID=G6XJ97_9PROT|nr:flagellar motor switch protein FliM [Gluconobacter morbifer]EHH68213.1 flagellar motor switch protein FliM [Gluconobacter morbifer G707]
MSDTRFENGADVSPPPDRTPPAGRSPAHPGQGQGFVDGNEGTGRILDAAEANRLARNDPAFGTPAEGRDIERLISTTAVSYERLPMLEVVFDRFIRIFTTSLRNFTSDNVEVTLDQLSSQRFEDYLAHIPGQSMFAVFKAEEWDNYGVLVISSPLIYSVVDALLGGHVRQDIPPSGMPDTRQPGRHHTAIERALIEPLVRMVLTDLATSFSPLCAVNFRFERLESNARFATICRASNGIVLSRFGIDMDGRGGDVDLVLPHAALEPVREILLQQFMGEKFGHDGIWENHLAEELWQTDMTLDVVLEEQTMNLSDILALAPGDRLILRRDPEALVRIRCGGRTMFHGKLGKRHGHAAVRIEETVNQNTGSDRFNSYS